MSSPTKGFSVKPDQLTDVADAVKALLDDLSGNTGYVPGNLPRYREKAGKQLLEQALASFWSGEDVFATAYGYEHDGIVQTMNEMVKQLTQLESACRTTAAQYQHRDTQSKKTVTNSDPLSYNQ